MAKFIGREGAGNHEQDYEVGYKKPPKSTQFAAGNKSGKGRPKGSPNMKTMVNAIAAERVKAQINGKQEKMPRMELILRQLANRALQGDAKAVDRLLPLFERFEVPAEASDISDQTIGNELAAIEEYLLYSGKMIRNDEA